MSITSVVNIIGMCSVAISTVLLPYILLSIGVKFDKLFKSVHPNYDSRLFFFSFISRTASYVICILVQSKFEKNPYTNQLYGDYNFYANSSLMQRIACYLSAITTFAAVIFGFIGLLLNVI